MTTPLTALSLCDRCGGSGKDIHAMGSRPLPRGQSANARCHGCGGTGRKTVTLAPEGVKALFREMVEDRVQDVCDDMGDIEIPTENGAGALVDAQLFTDWFAPEGRAHPEHGK